MGGRLVVPAGACMVFGVMGRLAGHLACLVWVLPDFSHLGALRGL